jgi:erythromycin esterase
MAKAVSALADSIQGSRKVVVWLHNDHGRYGNFSMQSAPHRSAGSYLREYYGDEVFSVGLFMGRGTIANNGRTIREVAVPDPDGVERFLGATGASASYLILRGNSDPVMQEWASTDRPYMRLGTRLLTIVPANEFDALLYIDRVGPPNYEIR